MMTHGSGAMPPEVILVDRDNVRIDRSCIVRFAAASIVDADGNGVVHLITPGIVVDFEGGHLRGATRDVAPDGYGGLGVVIRGNDVAVRNLRVSGYRVGIAARDASGLVIEDCDVSENFRQRLRSTPQAEDGGDWLWPHENDADEWIERYGAGLWIKNARGITVRRVRARDGQNGIVLDRVEEGRVYDNDCSFLSGWGLALWRSRRNLICRNAFDFCIRGYSHGAYNRGQDSAGILLFEQCSGNVIAENSATHCGDGFFAFAGKEALGELDPRDDLDWYARRGNNGNLLIANDFSYAAAHGIEITFSFDNRLVENRLTGNAICGVWGGYSQDTLIVANHLESNGEMGYGLERGGINIEHGRGNVIEHNLFVRNACGVHLWWDEDRSLMALPWAQVNERGSTRNVIAFNRFVEDELAVHLRTSTETVMRGNVMLDVGRPVLAEASRVQRETVAGPPPVRPSMPYDVIGVTRPVGARAELAGREHMVMTEWGPYDWQRPFLQRVSARGGRHELRLLGPETAAEAQLDASPSVRLVREADDHFVVDTDVTGKALPYRLTVSTPSAASEASGVLLPLQWTVRLFAWQRDPREDAAAWQAAREGAAATITLDSLDLVFGTSGPRDAIDVPLPAAIAGVGADSFGTVASTRVELPPGKWRLRTRSDDGIRVWLDGALVIDDWTWHAPRAHEHVIDVGRSGRKLDIHVEHFELDGYAVLSVSLEPVRPD
jgi:hypothetical protein